MSPKLIALAVLAAVVLYLAYHAVQVYRHIKISTGLVARAVPFAAERGAGSPRLLVVGDSTAVGVGASSPSYTTSGYFAAEHPQYSVSNRAVSGAKVADVLAQMRLASSSYAAILIQAGGNDIIRFTDLASLRRDYALLLGEATARSPHVVAASTGRVGRAALFNFFPANVIYDMRTRAVRRVLMDEAAKAGVTYVDIYKEGEADVISADPGRYYAPDGLHLNDAGWAVWYQDIGQALSRVLSR